MKKIPEIAFGFAVLFLMGLVFWHIIFNNVENSYPPVVVDPAPSAITNNVEEFGFKLEEKVRIEIGQPIEGFEPMMFMQVFPGLLPEDFAGVEAAIGQYEYKDGELKHELSEVDVVHSAASAITEAGVSTLLDNVTKRLGSDSVEEILITIGQAGPNNLVPLPLPPVHDYPVACTADAKICPDGTAVGRVGPNCEFASCSSEPIGCTEEAKECSDGSYVARTGPDCEFALCPNIIHTDPGSPGIVVECSPESKQTEICSALYAPVCGLVQVQCITTPCYPVQQTFSNDCVACGQGNVESYTTGECLLVN